MATIQQSTELSAFPGYIEVSRRFDQTGSGTGPVWTIEYRGTKDAIRTATFGWSSIGAKYSTIEEGPYASATVIFSGPTADPGDPIDAATVPVAGQETPEIRYEFRTDYVDVSVFALPAIDKEANSTGNPNLYKTVIETAAKNGELLSQKETNLGNATTFPMANKVWQMLYRGQDTFPTARVSLTRIATFSGNLGLPQVPNGIPPVYTPESFAINWNLPFSVTRMLPKVPIDPATGAVLAPYGTVWGWKQTNYSTSLITKTNQVEQVIAWTFAPYDTLVYPFF
jgi:hypothetical protein